VTLDSFRPRGLVLDLDGTVVDNMAVHAEAFRVFCERHGLPPFTEEMRLRLDGKRNRDIFPVLFDRALDDAEQRGYAGEKEGLYRELSCGRLRPMPGLLRLLDRADAAGVPVAIATSAPGENVRHTLAELGLAARLSRVARSDEVPRGKPHPDVFLAAARLIDRAPGDCLAFEDAPPGLVAARAAGMRTVAMCTTFTPERIAEACGPADAHAADYDELLARFPRLLG
jgi:HAD superfamily hydrolase (TIGR01509 family)